MESLQDSESETSLFDNRINPLAQKILSKKDVARLFRKTPRWVERMAARGNLIPRYVGDTAMFYADEILQAFLSGRLAQPRRTNTYEHHHQEKQERDGLLRSDRQTSERKKTLSQIRHAASRR